MKHTGLADCSDEVALRLERYVAMVWRWNPTINLVAPNDMENIWDRHVADSLQLVPLMPNHSTVAADLGSGGGFPGLVLAIATGCHFHLVESDARKASFLTEASRAVGAVTTVHAQRIESARLPPIGLITARALAPLTQLIALAEPHMGPNTVLLAPKGAKANSELIAAQERWRMKVRSISSKTDPRATIFHLSEIHRVDLS